MSPPIDFVFDSVIVVTDIKDRILSRV